MIQAHITSEASVEELRNTSEVDVEKDASLDGDDTKSKAELDIVSDAITILQGRPDVSKILEAEVAVATGPMSVDGTFHVASLSLSARAYLVSPPQSLVLRSFVASLGKP